jgi:hypothetical protein
VSDRARTRVTQIGRLFYKVEYFPAHWRIDSAPLREFRMGPFARRRAMRLAMRMPAKWEREQAWDDNSVTVSSGADQ